MACCRLFANLSVSRGLIYFCGDDGPSAAADGAICGKLPAAGNSVRNIVTDRDRPGLALWQIIRRIALSSSRLLISRKLAGAFFYWLSCWSRGACERNYRRGD